MSTNETNELLKQILEVLTELKNVTLKPVIDRYFPAPINLNEAQPIVEKAKPKIQPASPNQRLIVDKTLTKDFDVEVEPMDGSKYKFTIVVPEKYSAIPPVQRGPKIRDLRPKVLNYADGDAVIEQWSEMVFKSFPPDIQSVIANERQNA